MICPGVKALTNLSSETIISSVASTIGAACVLTVDACVCTDAKRLCSTIQLTSSGMRTYYNTTELCQSTLGVPVISIVVPTTIRAADLSAQKDVDPKLILTPLHVLDSVKIASFVIASAIAQVAYPELDYESSKQYIELDLFLGQRIPAHGGRRPQNSLSAAVWTLDVNAFHKFPSFCTNIFQELSSWA